MAVAADGERQRDSGIALGAATPQPRECRQQLRDGVLGRDG